MISTREAIGIAEIVIFVPLHLIAVYLSFRHSVYKQLAWLFLALLCALRIASGGLAIAVTRNPENITAAVWAVILGSIGLNPLLLATMGLLKTVNEQISPLPSRRIMLLRLLHIPCSLAIVLCIVGGVRQTDPNSTSNSSGKVYTKVGVIIFLFALVEIVVLALLTLPNAKKVPIAQSRLLYAVLLALPLLAVRLLYSILADFSSSKTFSATQGNPYVQLGMAIIEEMIVVVLYAAAGLAALGASYQAVAKNPELEYAGNVHSQEFPLNTNRDNMTPSAGTGV